MIRKVTVLLLAAALLLLCACAQTAVQAQAENIETAPSPQTPPADEKAAAAEIYVAELLSSMTLEEKVGQMFFAGTPGINGEQDAAVYQFGGILLFGRHCKEKDDTWRTKESFAAQVESYRTSVAIAPFIGSDEEGGTVTRLSRDPYLFEAVSLSPQELFARGGMRAILEDAAEKSRILFELGVNVNFAPVCDISEAPGDYMFARSFGQDAQRTAAYIAELVPVMTENGICAVLKHFPGYGPNLDTHTGMSVDSRAMETFEKSDFLPFQAGLEAGAPFVLVSHNIVTCMDAENPASLSPAVHTLLRQMAGEDVLLITDSLSMAGTGRYRDGEEAVAAVLAGNDMLVSDQYAEQYNAVLRAIQEGRIQESVVDTAVERILRTKLRCGVITLP